MANQPEHASAPPARAYATTSVLIWVTYAGLVLLATQLLPFHSPVATAAATLVTAGLLHPLRRRAQRAAKRRFGHR